MAIGYESNVTQQSLNQQLGQVTVALRDACQSAAQMFTNVNTLGVPGLEALGFTAADAQAFFTAANYAQTVAQLYYGTAQQTPAFSFDSALAAARGGQ